MKIVIKIVSGIISFILICTLIISLYLMISSRITGSQPVIMGSQLMLVLSGSMEPKLKTGSVIGVKPVEDSTSLEVGDVITFYSPIKKNTIVTHRIIEKSGQGEFTEYTTQGDNNDAKDPRPVTPDKIIGKYSEIQVPFAGYILGFLQSKKGIAMSLIIPGLLLIIYNAFSLYRLFKQWDPTKKIPPIDNQTV
jgi:signal peptidase I